MRRFFNTKDNKDDEKQHQKDKKLQYLHYAVDITRIFRRKLEIRKLVASIISLINYNSLFAKTKVNSDEIVALLDTGASANFIGKGGIFAKTRPKGAKANQSERSNCERTRHDHFTSRMGRESERTEVLIVPTTILI